MIAAWVCAASFGAASAESSEGELQELYRHAAVAADHVIASRAGVEMLRRGGNAVDAAVATSFCLSVVRPYSCGIGGGGFMVIYIPASNGEPARSIALDYRERAPAAVDRDYYARINQPHASRHGAHAVAVPGTVAGLTHALHAHGRLDLKTVLQPAIRAAEEGFAADANFISAMREMASALDSHPAARDFAEPIWRDLCHGGELKVGDVIRQPQKARTLRLIAEHGADVFYRGAVGRAIVDHLRSHGSPMTLNDLAEFRVVQTQPLHSDFLDYTVLSMPPPSSGGVAMQQIFGILSNRHDELKAFEHNSADYMHLLAEALKHAFADRSRWLADPEFADVPVNGLTAPPYLADLARRISMAKTGAPETYGSAAPLPDDGGTSHLCVIDSSGMAVACTETVNTIFGSLMMVPDYGIVLNNEMDDFTTVPGATNAFGLTQSDLNLPAPRKRPLSSMSPTIVLQDGRAMLIAGGSGGPRIISGTTQVILNCLWFDMTPAEAVSALRIHHQWLPNRLEVEGDLDQGSRGQQLRERGHDVVAANSVGVIQVIRVDNDGIRAASDPRKGGSPAGY